MWTYLKLGILLDGSLTSHAERFKSQSATPHMVECTTHVQPLSG